MGLVTMSHFHIGFQLQPYAGLLRNVAIRNVIFTDASLRNYNLSTQRTKCSNFPLISIKFHSNVFIWYV